MMIRPLMFMYKKLHLELSTYFQIFFNGCHRCDGGGIISNYCDENPSSIYSCSIGHILEHEFFCLGRFGSSGSKEKKWI